MASSFPKPRTAFFGRSRSVAEVRRQLARYRLVTLTGIGGAGKTRLALRVAEDCVPEIADDACWVDLAPLDDPGLVVPTVCSATDAPSTAGTPLVDALVNRLRSSRMLLVLDNCEHVIEACSSLVSTLLARCPGLRILATGREALGVEGEALWLVPPLSVPDDSTGHSDKVDKALKSASVQLFVDRAQLACPGFELTAANVDAVVLLCRRLEGIPLALELAAARVPVLTAEQIADRVGEGLGLLGKADRDAPRRHRTMEAALAWSHDLLSDAEKALFRRLAVFRGHTDIEACEAACAGGTLERATMLNLLSGLVDKSLVSVGERDGSAGYRLLEPVRQFAMMKLDESGELDSVRRKHAVHFLEVAQSAAHKLHGPDRALALDRLKSAHDNLRSAWDFAASSGDSATVSGLARALFWFWQFAGHFGEARTRSEEALECLSPGGKTRADLEYTAGSLAWMQGDYTVARERLEACAAECRGGAYDALYPLALRELAGVHFALGEPEIATELYDKSIARLRESGSAWDLALALVVQADVRDALGDSTSGRGLREEAQRLFRDAGDPWGLSLAQFGLALGAARQKDWKRARTHAREALELQRSEGDAWSNGQTLALLGEIEIGAGHARQAAGLLSESMRAFGEVRDRTSLVHVILTLAEVERRRGRIRRAVRLVAAGHAQAEQLAGSYLYSLATAEDRAQTVEALRRKAGQAAFDEEWVAGGSLPFDAAVAFAVDVTEPESREIPEASGGSEAALRVFALGPPAVYRSGRRLQAADWTYALPKELLFYLLVHGPRTKEQIGLVFWPEASTDELRGRFRTTLYQLRRALGGNEWVLFRNGRYEFNRKPETWFDVEVFESALERAGALADNDARRAAEALERAVDLYRGDFFEGERAADWVLDHRERLRQRYFDALIMLGGLRTAERAFDAAAACYRRAVAQDTLDERAHLELARCLALAGDRAAAVRQLDELSRLLNEDLDAEPSEAARELRARLARNLKP